jgi:hypothetical protein
MTKDEALKLALEAFAQYMPYQLNEKERIAEAAIKEVLAQPEPEYLAFMDTPQRTWVGLTDVDAVELWQLARHDIVEFARAIEAKLKEKNT